MANKTRKPVSSKGTHLTIEDRAKIEYGLNRGHSIRSIAREVGKSPSTVKREIERNWTLVENDLNACAKLHDCKKRHVCGLESCKHVCSYKCKSTCNRWCDEYDERSCDKLNSSPHVCNACSHSKRQIKACSLNRRIYIANEAHNRYRELLVERRKGFDMTLGELIDLDKVVSPLLKRGQSPYHIAQSNILPVSLATLYRIVDSGELNAGNIDLKQKVRRKPRKTSRHNEKLAEKIFEAKVGHMYNDYLNYMEAQDTFHVEMDCVLGKQGESPALLTLHYPGLQMQLAFYLPEHTASSVVQQIDSLEMLLGYELFCEAFPVILTDNGSEFADVESIERSISNSGKQRTRLFFCEPNRAYEKGSCENNHRFIREVIPKGTSLLQYQQHDITLMMNHINSYCRKKSFGKCAYDMAMDVFPREYFDVLGLYKIDPNEVLLKPRLLSAKK